MKAAPTKLNVLMTLLLFTASAEAYIEPACNTEYHSVIQCSGMTKAIPKKSVENVMTYGLSANYEEFVLSQNPKSNRICSSPMGVLLKYAVLIATGNHAASADGQSSEKIPNGLKIELTNFKKSLENDKDRPAEKQFVSFQMIDGKPVAHAIMNGYLDYFGIQEVFHNKDTALDCQLAPGTIPPVF